MSFSNEINDDDDIQTDGSFDLNKRPSWAVGKRIIEFKRQFGSQTGGGDLERLLKLLYPSDHHYNAVRYPNRKSFLYK